VCVGRLSITSLINVTFVHGTATHIHINIVIIVIVIEYCLPHRIITHANANISTVITHNREQQTIIR
jgi:hypothetical protein